MSKPKPYVRSQRGLKGGKYETCEQDVEDFEQEKLIQEWLDQTGAGEIEFKYISRKGTARNTLDKRSVRLDAQVSDEAGSRAFADIIAGSDGRDLECGGVVDESEPKTAAEKLDENIYFFFDAIGVSEETKVWAKKSIKSAESLRKLPSLMKDDEPSNTLEISSVSPIRLPSFEGL